MNIRREWNMDIKCHQSYPIFFDNYIIRFGLPASYSLCFLCLVSLMIEPKRQVRIGAIPNGFLVESCISFTHNSDECQARCAKGQNSGLFSTRCFRQSFLALQNILFRRKKSFMLWTHLFFVLIPSFLPLRTSYSILCPTFFSLYLFPYFLMLNPVPPRLKISGDQPCNTQPSMQITEALRQLGADRMLIDNV